MFIPHALSNTMPVFALATPLGIVSNIVIAQILDIDILVCWASGTNYCFHLFRLSTAKIYLIYLFLKHWIFHLLMVVMPRYKQVLQTNDN